MENNNKQFSKIEETIITERKIISLNDFLDMEEKEQPFLLKGMIVEGSVNALTSDSGKGKSLFMLKAIEAIVKGEKFLGEIETNQAKTLILDLEMSENDIVQRTHSVIQNKMDGLDFYTCQGFNICNDDDLNWLKKVIVERDYKLIVLDTFSMMHDKNENDNSEMNVVNKKMLKITNELKVTILFLHHHRKPAKGEIMSQSSSRGATDIINKTAGHMLLDSKEIIIANEKKAYGSEKGLILTITQMKKRQIVGFEKFSILVWYDPFTKHSNFKFEGYEDKAETAMEKTKSLILQKMEYGKEYIMKNIKDLVGRSSNTYDAMKELIEIDKKVSFRMPRENEKSNSGNKIRKDSKIYFLPK